MEHLIRIEAIVKDGARLDLALAEAYHMARSKAQLDSEYMFISDPGYDDHVLIYPQPTVTFLVCFTLEGFRFEITGNVNVDKIMGMITERRKTIATFVFGSDDPHDAQNDDYSQYIIRA